MRTHYALQVDAGADIAGEPVVIDVPTGIDFMPSAIFYSPNHQYVVYMQPVEPGGLPSVYDGHADKVSKLFEAYSGGRFLGWHPDGKRFLFWIDSVALWLINAETAEIITLAYPEGPLQGAAISPDGLNVSYIANFVRGVDNSQTVYGDTLWSVSNAGSDAKPYPEVGEALSIYPP